MRVLDPWFPWSGETYSAWVDRLADLQEQNQILREGIERLESASREGADPVLKAFIEHAPAFITVMTPDARFLAAGRTSEAFGSVIGRTRG